MGQTIGRCFRKRKKSLNKEPTCKSLGDMPIEIINIIALALKPNDKVSLAGTCRSFRDHFDPLPNRIDRMIGRCREFARFFHLYDFQSRNETIDSLMNRFNIYELQMYDVVPIEKFFHLHYFDVSLKYLTNDDVIKVKNALQSDIMRSWLFRVQNGVDIEEMERILELELISIHPERKCYLGPNFALNITHSLKYFIIMKKSDDGKICHSF